MLYPLIRKFFFALDAETAHGIGMNGIDFANATGLSCLVTKKVAPCPVEVMGLRFPNPVGLAAGLDKNGDHIDGLARLGFGFIEIGTITPRPQDGNPKPRLFRIPEAQGIINRMGFNNAGVDKLLENVRRAEFPKKGGILGINIGKNATTPIEKAADDYLICLDKVYNDASYVAVNISSPNTKNLRELQKDEALDDLLSQLKAKQLQLADQHGKYVPMALKIAPDLDDEQMCRKSCRLPWPANCPLLALAASWAARMRPRKSALAPAWFSSIAASSTAVRIWSAKWQKPSPTY